MGSGTQGIGVGRGHRAARFANLSIGEVSGIHRGSIEEGCRSRRLALGLGLTGAMLRCNDELLRRNDELPLAALFAPHLGRKLLHVARGNGASRRFPERDHAMNIDVSKMSAEEMAALIPALLAKLEEASKPKALTCKVSEKGALSVYGLGRFPVTLYRGQWERLFNARQQIADFIKANATLLSIKGE